MLFWYSYVAAIYFFPDTDKVLNKFDNYREHRSVFSVVSEGLWVEWFQLSVNRIQAIILALVLVLQQFGIDWVV